MAIAIYLYAGICVVMTIVLADDGSLTGWGAREWAGIAVLGLFWPMMFALGILAIICNSKRDETEIEEDEKCTKR